MKYMLYIFIVILVIRALILDSVAYQAINFKMLLILTKTHEKVKHESKKSCFFKGEFKHIKHGFIKH